MNTIEVTNESGDEVDEAALLHLAGYVLRELGVNPLAELSLLLVDAPAMEALHLRWMDLPGPTDVMAFPMDAGDTGGQRGRTDPSAPSPDDASPSEPALLGDVVVCPSVAAEQAARAGHSTAAELSLLATHGILHLLGYDHDDTETEREMFTLQSRLLASWTAETDGEPIRTPRPGTAAAERDIAGRGQ